MLEREGYNTCPFARIRIPISVTLVTESAEQKIRRPAIAASLCETGGEFTSRQRVTPGETIGLILHPDLRYAVRGRVVWAHPDEDQNIEFGVAFEENIPESLWESLVELKAA